METNLSSILFESFYGGNVSILENYTTDSLPGAIVTPTEMSHLLGHGPTVPGALFPVNTAWENISQFHQRLPLVTYLPMLATAAKNIIEANMATNGTLSMEHCVLMNVTFDPDGTSSSHPGIICLPHAPTLSKSGVIRVIVLSAMAMVSLLGNIATMCSIQRDRKTRRLARHNWSAIYSLIFHLSIADLLVTGFCMIGEAAWSYTVEWMAGMVACKLFKLLQMFSLYLSTYVLVLVGVDRWVAVKYPMKSLNTARRCHRYLLGAYTVSFVLSIPQ
ncbi:gonadotropin-releasing hormone receptor-like, partial [Topomyia yanbarensis]|uniref:gonadotropin-releasing hormone receptor-like n=1 Tax=Topomyia yanbarensis TaxID=2498891 RepID=UPI00273B501C